MIEYILIGLYVLACLVLIFFVLLQPGKADAAAVFGGGGVNSSAFGPRGTATVLAKVTIGAAIVFFLIAFLFSIPGLFGRKSLGEGVGPAEAPPPAATETAPPTPAPSASPSPESSTGSTPQSKTDSGKGAPAQSKQKPAK